MPGEFNVWPLNTFYLMSVAQDAHGTYTKHIIEDMDVGVCGITRWKILENLVWASATRANTKTQTRAAAVTNELLHIYLQLIVTHLRHSNQHVCKRLPFLTSSNCVRRFVSSVLSLNGFINL